jgi:uncharacterized protein
VTSIVVARIQTQRTKSLLGEIQVDDSKLDELKRTGLGLGLYRETPARLYVSDYLMPNFYFHIAAAYAALRKLGVPLGKTDYMGFPMPHVRHALAPAER